MDAAGDLYHYLRNADQYKRLIPDNTTLRALALLHQRFGESASDEFREEDIRAALHQAYADADTPTEPDVPTREAYVSRVIRRLQVHILAASPRERVFRFTTYGRSLLINISGELTDKVDTTSLEHNLGMLVLTLQAIDANSFVLWEANDLSGKRQELEKPLQILDDNIRKTLRRLKEAGTEDETFLDTARQVYYALDALRDQAQELSRAFGQMDELTDRIDQLWQTAPLEPKAADAFAASAERAKQTFYAAKRRLSRLREWLEKAQPRVRELFSNLRKLQFDRKSEEFLRRLLRADHSDKPSTVVYLPDGLALRSPGLGPFHFEALSGNNRLFPLPRTKPPVRPASPERVEQLRQHVQNQLLVSDKLAEAIDRIEQQLREKPEVNFTGIAADLLRDQPEWAGVIIAKLLALITRQEAAARGWGLCVDRHETILTETTTSTSLTLWNLRILRPLPLLSS